MSKTVVVPREPTPEMLAAVSGLTISVRVSEDDYDDYPVSADDCEEIYRAMLAAAPPWQRGNYTTEEEGDAYAIGWVEGHDAAVAAAPSPAEGVLSQEEWESLEVLSGFAAEHESERLIYRQALIVCAALRRLATPLPSALPRCENHPTQPEPPLCNYGCSPSSLRVAQEAVANLRAFRAFKQKNGKVTDGWMAGMRPVHDDEPREWFRAGDVQALVTHIVRTLAPAALSPQGAPLSEDVMAGLIADELARMDGFDPSDKECGLYELRWQGNPPEPLGDGYTMDYLCRGESIAAALAAAMGGQSS